MRYLGYNDQSCLSLSIRRPHPTPHAWLLSLHPAPLLLLNSALPRCFGSSCVPKPRPKPPSRFGREPQYPGRRSTRLRTRRLEPVLHASDNVLAELSTRVAGPTKHASKFAPSNGLIWLFFLSGFPGILLHRPKQPSDSAACSVLGPNTEQRGMWAIPADPSLACVDLDLRTGTKPSSPKAADPLTSR